MQTENHLVIQTFGLTKTYKGANALQKLNLQMPQNSICAFLGPNGGGKSTSIKLLLGLIRPTERVRGHCGRDRIARTVRAHDGQWAPWLRREEPRFSNSA